MFGRNGLTGPRGANRCIAHGLHRGRRCPTCWAKTDRGAANRVRLGEKKHAQTPRKDAA